MSTLQVRLQDIATRVATECKSIRTLLNANAGDLAALTTTTKTNLVAALNELKASIDQVAGASGATINDGSTTATTQTWSVSKIASAINDSASATQSAILGGADAAYDTLKELETILQGDDTSIAALLTAVGNKVAFDTATQGLTTTQQQNARTNINAYGSVELGNPDTNLVTVFEAGLT